MAADMSNSQNRNALPVGTQLHWYTIQRVLGQGGFGITYLAEDGNLKQQVAIKEFLPVGMAVRESDQTIHPASTDFSESFKWGLSRFLSEARTLTQFEHPNVVRVLAVFELNQTAYMVMRYESGKELLSLLKEQQRGDVEPFDEAALKQRLFALIDGLKHVHSAGFIHRDIKPGNIVMRADGTPVLIDFGSAREAMGQQNHTLTAMISPGYAPFEQHHAKSKQQGPWTDIYGLAATMYRVIAGRAPMPALERSEALLSDGRDAYAPLTDLHHSGFSQGFLAAIDHGLAFRERDRPQSLDDWLKELKGDEPAPTRNATPTVNTEQQAAIADALAQNQLDAEALKLLAGQRPKRRKRGSILKLPLMLMLALGIGAGLAWIFEEPGVEQQPSPAVTVVSPGGQSLNAPQPPGAPAAPHPRDEDVVGLHQQLASQPGSPEIRARLRRVFEYHFARAERSLQIGDLNRARSDYAMAREAATDGAQLDQVDARLDSLY